jgi:hypothetical protein
LCIRCGSGSSVGVATDYGLDGPGSNPAGDGISAPLDRPWGPPSLLYNGYRVFPQGVKCGRGVLLTTHLLLVPRSWKSASTHPLGHTGPVTGSLYLSLYHYLLPFKLAFVGCNKNNFLQLSHASCRGRSVGIATRLRAGWSVLRILAGP